MYSQRLKNSILNKYGEQYFIVWFYSDVRMLQTVVVMQDTYLLYIASLHNLTVNLEKNIFLIVV